MNPSTGTTFMWIALHAKMGQTVQNKSITAIKTNLL